MLLRGLAERAPTAAPSADPRRRSYMGVSDDFHTLLRAHSLMTWQRSHDSTRQAQSGQVASAPAQQHQQSTGKLYTPGLMLSCTCSVLRKNMKKTGDTCTHTAGWGLGCR